MLHKIVTDANGEVIDGNKEWRNKYAQDSSPAKRLQGMRAIAAKGL